MAVAIQIDNKAENNIIQFPNSKKNMALESLQRCGVLNHKMK